MKGVVLAAGEGTRLRPLTADRPKGLVEVAGQPLLSYPLETLVSLDVDEIVVVVGYRGDDVVEHYGDAFGDTPLVYTRQRERDGLATALLTAEDHLDGDFVVVNGDNVYDADLTPLVERHREADADATLLVDEVSRERAREGAVCAFDDEGRLTGLVEKPAAPPSTRVPRGCYAFSPRILEACHRVEPSARGEYELTDAVDRLVRAGATVERVPFEGWCCNVNTPEDRERVARRRSS